MFRILVALFLVQKLPMIVVAQGGDYSCTQKASDKDTCDASKTSITGEPCVWCAYTFGGTCLTKYEAKILEKQFKKVICDYDHDNDDDDDDDDSVEPYNNDDLWTCLELKDDKACTHCLTADCKWCTSKGGYGMCLDHDAAELAKDSYWFDCDSTAHHDDGEDDVEMTVHTNRVDATCTTMAAQGGNTQEACGAIMIEDESGRHQPLCEWCSFFFNDNKDEEENDSFNVCLPLSEAKRVQSLQVALCQSFSSSLPKTRAAATTTTETQALRAQ